MSQLSLGNVLTHNNWSTHRQNEDNWSAHIQNSGTFSSKSISKEKNGLSYDENVFFNAAVPPPGFTLRHTGAEMKKTVTSGIESLE